MVARVQDVARQRGVSPTQVALAWLLQQPGVTAPMVGASKIAHLEEAVQALSLTLSADERRMVEEPYQPHAVLGHS